MPVKPFFIEASAMDSGELELSPEKQQCMCVSQYIKFILSKI